MSTRAQSSSKHEWTWTSCGPNGPKCHHRPVHVWRWRLHPVIAHTVDNARQPSSPYRLGSSSDRRTCPARIGMVGRPRTVAGRRECLPPGGGAPGESVRRARRSSHPPASAAMEPATGHRSHVPVRLDTDAVVIEPAVSDEPAEQPHRPSRTRALTLSVAPSRESGSHGSSHSSDPGAHW